METEGRSSRDNGDADGSQDEVPRGEDGMEEDEGGGEPREEDYKEGAGGRRNGDGDGEDGGGGEVEEDGDNANGGDEDGSATGKGISLKKNKPKKRRGPKMGMPSSKRKKHDGDDGATNRDPAILAMLRLDDLSPLDLATLMSFSGEASGGLGGAARSRRVLHLAHPRVTEHPYHGSLRSYVLGQLKAMSGQGGLRNLLHSERFAGFAGLMYSMSGVLCLQREGAAEARRVARELFSDVDVVEGLVHVTVRFLVGEMPQNRAPQMGAGVGKATEEGQEMEKALVLKVSNLLGMAHNLLSYELEDGEERAFWVSLERLRVMQALTVSSLDILDMQVLKHGAQRGPEDKMRKAVYNNKPCGGLGTKRWAATTLFSRALSVWNDLFVVGLVEGDVRRACLKMFYRHRNLEQFLVLLEQRVGKKDAQCESALKLLHMLIKETKLPMLISRSPHLSRVRDGLLHSLLAEMARFKHSSDTLQRLSFKILIILLEDEDVKGACIFVESNRNMLLDGIHASMTFYEKEAEAMIGEERGKGHDDDDDDDDEGRRVASDAADFLAIYARLARGDARPFAAALVQKFGGTPSREERILLHLERVRNCKLYAAGVEEDACEIKAVLDALQDRERLAEFLQTDGAWGRGKDMSEVAAELETLQKAKGMAEGALDFSDNERGMAYIQCGQSVLVEGEISQQFRFKDKHIDWLRRRKNADEPVPFVMLARNVYLHRRYRVLKPDDIQVCRCRKWPGKDGCSDDTCLLRQLYVECTPGFCPCQETCTNQKFQKCQYASTEVRKTQGRGFGLFALEDMEKDRFVIEYMGEVVNKKQYEKRRHQYEVEHNTYFMSLRTEPNFEMIDASRKSTMARFLNHSCDPNCETRKWLSLGEMVVGFFTKRFVKKGEELTFDYQMVDGALGKRCTCGSKNCRGSLTQKTKEELLAEKKKHKAKGKKKRRKRSSKTAPDWDDNGFQDSRGRSLQSAAERDARRQQKSASSAEEGGRGGASGASRE